jgi:hypothetical protein
MLFDLFSSFLSSHVLFFSPSSLSHSLPSPSCSQSCYSRSYSSTSRHNREYLDLSKPRGDLTVLEASIVRAVLGDELCPTSAASPSASPSASPPPSVSESPSVSGLTLSSTCSRDGDGIQGRNNISSPVAEGSVSSTSTARTADRSSRQGADSIGKERSSSSSVTSSLTCNDAISILHGPVDDSITSVTACSIAARIQLPSNIEHAINIDKRNSAPKTDYILGLKRGKYKSGKYDEEREQIEAKRCLGLLTPAACFAFSDSRKKRRRNADQDEYLEEDEERAEECGSYVKIRPNVGATSKSPLKAGDDLRCADSDIDRKKRKSPVVANGVDMDDMAATMGFSYFKNNYKS